jgi:hypothetical protein
MHLLLMLLACESSPTPPAVPAPPVVPAAPVAAEHHHEGTGDHGHGAKHGGIQKELDGMHLEGLITPENLDFWLADKDANAMPLQGITATAMVKGPAGVEQLNLSVVDDHFHTPVKLAQGQPATVVVTLMQAGKAQSASYEIPAVGLALHDHQSLHGGQVSMSGDYHLEYLGKEGVYQVWVSNAARQPVTNVLSGSLKDGDKTITLSKDPTTGMLSASGEGAGTRPVMVEVKVPDKTITLGFN